MSFENGKNSGGAFTSSNHFQKARKNTPNQGNYKSNPQNSTKRNSRQQQNNANKLTRNNSRGSGSITNVDFGSLGNKNGRRVERDSTKTNKFRNTQKTSDEQSQKRLPTNQNQLNSTINVFPNSSTSTMSETSMMSNSTMTTNVSQSTDLSSFEKKLFGNLLKTPEALGFQKLKHKPLKLPKYMLKEHVLFDMSSFQKNNWDMANQQMLAKREQEYTGEPQLLFEEFQEHRKQEREMMEKLNLVDKENAKKSLDDAILFRGSCEDMCPVYERVERLYKNQVSQWEKDPVTKKISRNYAIKTFMRPSGQAPPLPSDVRPPGVLQKTLDYIIDTLIPHLPESQSFIWDRTRSIRQDFTFQNNYSGYESIDCHEKICRIHILSLHVMAGSNDPDYQQQQEVEQLNNSLQTLTHMYDDVRSRGGFCPNEPEFRAYELISKIKDTELDRYLQTLPENILHDQLLQKAMMLRGLIFEGINSVNLFTEFFKSVFDKNSTFLLASLAEIHFNEIRYTALRALGKAYHSKAKKLPTAEHLVEMFQYNDIDQLMDTCRLYELPVLRDRDTNSMLVDVTQLKSSYKSTQKQVYTKAIDPLANGLSMSQIIKSGYPNSGLSLNTSKGVEQVARESFKASKKNTEAIENIFSHSGSYKATKLIGHNFASSLNIKLPETEDKPKFASNNDSANTSFFNSNNNITTYSNNTIKSATLNNMNEDRSKFNVVNVPNTSKNKVMLEKHSPTEPNEVSTSNNFLSQETLSFPIVVNDVKSQVVKHLTKNPNFKEKALEYVNKVTNDVVKEVTEEVVTQQLSKEQKRRMSLKKSKVIDKISTELFAAFMREQVYLLALEARAVIFNKSRLRRSAILRVVTHAKNVAKRKELLSRKALEINNFVQHVSSPFIPPKPVNISSQDFEVTPKYNIEIYKIFENLDPPRNENICFVLRAPNSVSSKLILDQFGLSGRTSNEYKSKNNSVLKLEVLPDHFEPKEYFKEITTVVMQVGTVEGMDTPKRSALINCLIRDAKVLKKVVSYLNLFSTRKQFSFVVCYLDVFNHRLSYRDIKALLGLDQLKSHSVVIGFVRLNAASLSLPNKLGPLKKVHDDLIGMVKVLWDKSGNIVISSKDSSLDTINVIPGNNETLNATNLSNDQSKNNLSSKIMKRKLQYIEKVIGSASDTLERKRQKLRTGTSAIRNASTNLNDFTRNSIPNNSLMLLRRGYRNTSFSGIGSSCLSMVDNIDSISEVSEQIDEHKISELEELDELAESVLKS